MPFKVLRVVHYLNQFFGGIGGEDKADVGPELKNGPLGPGKAIQNALGSQGEVVATISCGDNYFAERVAEATEKVIQLLIPYQPDVVIAGPAFNAGRYGVACGSVCKAVKNRLGIPAVTGMYKENPGVELFRKDVYILQTGASVREMADAVSKMVNIALRLSAGLKIGRPAEEGYFPQGFIVNEVSDKTAAERVVSMLLSKLKGQPFESEIPLPKYEPVPPAPGIKDLRSATIALVTDGGLVPKGNPDRIEIESATRFGSYSIRGLTRLNPENYEVRHPGYHTFFIRQEPHRLVPLDVMRDLEKEGVIGRLHEAYYTTNGCGNTVGNCQNMGQAIAEQLRDEGVSGAILTST